jgi:hypothetical protein
MRLRRRTRLNLERLENRDCPSLTTVFRAGSLTITGVPLANDTTNPGQEFVIQRMAGVGSTVQVFDQAAVDSTGLVTSGTLIGNFNLTGTLTLNLSYYRAT